MRVLRVPFWIHTFSSIHKFSIGLRSRDWCGHCRMYILFELNHDFVSFVVFLGSLFCLKTQPGPANVHSAENFSPKYSDNIPHSSSLQLYQFSIHLGQKAIPDDNWFTSKFYCLENILRGIFRILISPDFCHSISASFRLINAHFYQNAEDLIQCLFTKSS